MAFILDNILLSPCKFVTWIGHTLYDQAEGQITDESVIHHKLMELQTQFELGQVAEEEFIRSETALMRRLNEIHKYKESKRQG